MRHCSRVEIYCNPYGRGISTPQYPHFYIIFNFPPVDNPFPLCYLSLVKALMETSSQGYSPFSEPGLVQAGGWALLKIPPELPA